MAKRIFIDIVPVHKRETKPANMPVKDRRPVESPAKTEVLRRPAKREVRDHHEKRGSRKAFWVAAFICLAALAAVISSLYANGFVSVSPKVLPISVNGKYSASPDGGPGALTYGVLSETGEESVVVPATGTKNVERRASGKIAIFNSYSSKEQRLVKNTRFQTQSGLIYRIDSSVVVPGKTVENGKVVPGSVRGVVVYADAPGEEYNGSETDFTIPAFRGTDKYSSFFARSETPLSGGMIGAAPAVPAEAVAAARSSLRSSLQAKLTDKIRAGLSDEYVLYDNAVFTVFDPLRDIDEKDGLKVGEKATVYAIVFRRSELTASVVGQKIKDVSAVMLKGLDSLVLAPVNASAFTPSKDKPFAKFDFTLKGDSKAVWNVDGRKLAAALAGKPKSALSAEIAAFPGILKATASIRPPWVSLFPKDTDRIKVQISED